MGPEASAYFYHLLIRMAHTTYAAVQDSDFPPVLIYNLPLEGFDERGIVDAEAVRDQLICGVQKLESAGADLVIIACNTVHVFQESMQAQIRIPLLSIVDETVAEVCSRGYKAVGLLTSASTRAHNLYTDKLVVRGVCPVVVNPAQQEQLDAVILHVMAGVQGAEDGAVLQEISGALYARGAEAIILGCTELPLAASQVGAAISVLNANEIIIDCALAWVMDSRSSAM